MPPVDPPSLENPDKTHPDSGSTAGLSKKLQKVEDERVEVERAEARVSRWNYIEAPVRVLCLLALLGCGLYSEAIFNWLVLPTPLSGHFDVKGFWIKPIVVEGVLLIFIYIIFDMAVWRQRRPWDTKLKKLHENRRETERLSNRLRLRFAELREKANSVYRSSGDVSADLSAIFNTTENILNQSDEVNTSTTDVESNNKLIDRHLVTIQAKIDQELHRQKEQRRTDRYRYIFCILHFIAVSYVFSVLYETYQKHNWKWDGMLWGLNLPANVIMFSWIGSTLAILWRTQEKKGSTRFSDEFAHLLVRPVLGVGMGIIAYLTLSVGLKGLTGGLGEQPQQPSAGATMLCTLVVGFYDKEWIELIVHIYTRIRKSISVE